jgi:hypothetical protein
VVAVAAERVMPQTLRHKQRRKVLTQACDLASSGECASHQEVISRLMVTEDALIVREFLGDRRFCAQLDTLCAMAQGRRGA